MLMRALWGGLAGAAPPPGSPPTLNAVYGRCFTPGDGGGYIEVLWSVNNPVGGEYIRLEGVVNSGDPITATGIYASPGNITASPAQHEIALGMGADGSCDVKLYSSAAALLQTASLGSGAYPT